MTDPLPHLEHSAAPDPGTAPDGSRQEGLVRSDADSVLPSANRARLDSIFREDAYNRTLGIEVAAWGVGWAEVSYYPTTRHSNFIGTLHGGAIFSVADAALGLASNSHGRQCFAVSIEAHYLAIPNRDERLLARAVERHVGQRIASYLIDVTGPERGLVASFQALVHRSNRWHLGDDAWPASWRSAH